MKRKTKKLLLCLIAVAVVFVMSISAYYLINKSAIKVNNRCSLYVDIFLYDLPENEVLLEEIKASTAEFIKKNTIESGFYFSDYQKKYISDNSILDMFSTENEEIYKQKYYNEVVMLRLKVLAVQGEKEEYNDLFSKSIYNIESNFFTRCQYVNCFMNDDSYPIKWNSELYKTIEEPLLKIYEETDDLITRFYILYELRYFYRPFDECSAENEYYTKELSELIKSNKEELKEEIEKSA